MANAVRAKAKVVVAAVAECRGNRVRASVAWVRAKGKVSEAKGVVVDLR